MGYRHIINLEKPEAQIVFLFREVYAMEKVDGTSAHIAWRDGQVHYFHGGSNREQFLALFDQEALKAEFERRGHPNVTIYGEAYGSKVQAMAKRYGKDLKFVAFEVKIGEDYWLDVPEAAKYVEAFGLEFVHYQRVNADLDTLTALRDAPSKQAERNGMGVQPSEGIVIRPLVEMRRGDARIIFKYRTPESRERKKVVKPGDAVEVLTAANAIADEWVVPKRLEHVLSAVEAKLDRKAEQRDTGTVLDAMEEDVLREAGEEIVDTREARKAIRTKARELFFAHLSPKVV